MNTCASSYYFYSNRIVIRWRVETRPALREAEKANIPFLAALAGALRRCSSLVWLATRRSERLALHPASAPKNGISTISASLTGVIQHRNKVAHRTRRHKQVPDKVAEA